MSKFGWSLPPGVSQRMIDEQSDYEGSAFFEALDDQCRAFNCAYPDERLAEWLWQQIGVAYHDGYKAAVADDDMAREAKERSE